MASNQTIRLSADYVLTCDGSNGGRPGHTSAGGLIANGAIDIGDDGRIVAVGAEAELDPHPSTRRVGGLLMPGLINTHAHTPMTLLRSVGDGLPLERWLKEAVWPLEGRMSPDDARAGMALGSVEMLLAGVTTSCEMYFYEEALVDAVAETGGRMVVTPGVIAALAPNGDVGPRMEEISTFHAAHHEPDNRITVGFAPHSIYDLSPEQCGEIAARAQAVDALLHIHLDETQAERELITSNWGKSGTALLAEHGALDGPVLAAHGVWLDDDDRRLLAEAGAAIAHCPQSNLKLGSGIAPVAALLAAGVRVGLGTDGPASNDDLDLWEELRLTPLLARGAQLDPQAMTADVALGLATREAARALRLDDVGVLEPGAWADVIRVDLDVPGFSPCREETLVTQLVFAGSSRWVTDVWVAGRQVVADSAIQTVDVGSLMADSQKRAERLAAG